ncbi:protease modulator HflK [Sphingomonas pokkalii]|uniref:Protease modulator HflK n=1 Tax=Sphingomonas pokkalii TaxID=2175090 RepID=A0A2U0SAZ0_9SPHN|nr:protease modulator HflK [Sphingomonas pokkalii]PVX28445.1 protease modulator HflK [Sphingomonas pokkalii]
MANSSGRDILSGTFHNEAPKSPWGGGNGGGSDKGGGPRNPWSVPPGGRRTGNGSASAIDELWRRARNGGGGGFPGVPSGSRLWLLILAALIGIWVMFTSIHPIGPREKGVVTFLGRYSGTLDPGIRFTLPAPFQLVDVVDVGNIRTENFPASGENLMLTGGQNIVDLAYSVRWDVRSAPLYVFQLSDPRETVRATAESAMRAVIANTSLNEAIGEGRSQIEAEAQVLMQQILDEYQSGIRIQGVAVQKAAAPSQVDEDFKAVTAATQEAESNRNNANAYAQRVIAAAQGEAAEFDKIYEQYKLAPEVTKRRLYYETMESVLARTNKTIIEAPGVNSYLPLPQLRGRGGTEPNAAKGDAK